MPASGSRRKVARASVRCSGVHSDPPAGLRGFEDRANDPVVGPAAARIARKREPHFGLAVDDKEAARRRLAEAGVEVLPGRFFDIRDPSGNRVQIVQYDEIQFTKTDRVLAGMGLELGKSERALGELREQGLAD